MNALSEAITYIGIALQNLVIRLQLRLHWPALGASNRQSGLTPTTKKPSCGAGHGGPLQGEICAVSGPAVATQARKGRATEQACSEQNLRQNSDGHRLLRGLQNPNSLAFYELHRYPAGRWTSLSGEPHTGHPLAINADSPTSHPLATNPRARRYSLPHQQTVSMASNSHDVIPRALDTPTFTMD